MCIYVCVNNSSTSQKSIREFFLNLRVNSELGASVKGETAEDLPLRRAYEEAGRGGGWVLLEVTKEKATTLTERSGHSELYLDQEGVLAGVNTQRQEGYLLSVVGQVGTESFPIVWE